MDFEPVEGSIASVAITDPQFHAFKWVYGSQPVPNASGDNWEDLVADYKGQVLNFTSQVRDQKISELTENPLDEDRIHLKEPLRQALKCAMEIFESCEDFLSRCNRLGSTDSQNRVQLKGSTNSTSCQSSGQSEQPKPRSWLRIKNWYRKCFRGSCSVRKIASLNRSEQEVSTQANGFGELLKQLKQALVSVLGDIQAQQNQSVISKLAMNQKLKQQVPFYEKAGDRLTKLIESLKTLPERETNDVAFQLRLYHDPFGFQKSLKSRSRVCHEKLQTGGASFYMRLERKPTQPTDPVKGADAKYFIFDVLTEEHGTEDGDQISSVHQQLLTKKPSSTDFDWGTFIGHMGRAIRVVLDETTHMQEQRLIDCLRNEEERETFQDPSYAIVKAQLAMTAATSLFYSLLAEQNHDLEAQNLSYYTALERSGSEPELTSSRIIPFMPLTTLGATTLKPSSARVLDDLEREIIQKLGILIFEIGSWTKVEGPLARRILMVKTQKGDLQSIHPKYLDVINACLQYQKTDDMKKWLLEHVVIPLKEAYEGIGNM